MARREWVPLFATINTSGKLAGLPSDSARMFYLLLLPQCDGWGRVTADPGALDALVWPRLKRPVLDTARAILACERAGMLTVHAGDDGERFIQITGWDRKAGKVCGRMRRGPSSWSEPSPQSRVSHDSLMTECDSVTPSPLLSSPLVPVSVVSSIPTTPKIENGHGAVPAPAGLSPGAANGHKPVKQPKPAAEMHPEARRVAEYLGRGIRNWRPDEPVDTLSARSLGSIDLMLRRDRRDPQRTLAIIEWLFGGQKDDYLPTNGFDWRPNVRSGETLRKHWLRLDSQLTLQDTPAHRR